jgi:hypothetical protein
MLFYTLSTHSTTIEVSLHSVLSVATIGVKMIAIFLFLTMATATQSDYLNEIKKDMDNGAEWHYIERGQSPDPEAKQIFVEDKVYWKLK